MPSSGAKQEAKAPVTMENSKLTREIQWFVNPRRREGGNAFTKCLTRFSNSAAGVANHITATTLLRLRLSFSGRSTYKQPFPIAGSDL